MTFLYQLESHCLNKSFPDLHVSIRILSAASNKEDPTTNSQNQAWVTQHNIQHRGKTVLRWGNSAALGHHQRPGFFPTFHTAIFSKSAMIPSGSQGDCHCSRYRMRTRRYLVKKKGISFCAVHFYWQEKTVLEISQQATLWFHQPGPDLSKLIAGEKEETTMTDIGQVSGKGHSPSDDQRVSTRRKQKLYQQWQGGTPVPGKEWLLKGKQKQEPQCPIQKGPCNSLFSKWTSQCSHRTESSLIFPLFVYLFIVWCPHASVSSMRGGPCPLPHRAIPWHLWIHIWPRIFSLPLYTLEWCHSQLSKLKSPPRLNHHRFNDCPLGRQPPSS